VKIVLIQPPFEDFYQTDVRMQPLGLAYLKSALLRHLPELKIKIFDFRHGWPRKTIALPAELRHVRRYFALDDKSPFSTFFHYYRFGPEPEDIAEKIRPLHPDLVGISVHFSAYFREAFQLARVLKQQLGVPIVAGGAHASAVPEHILDEPAFDFVVVGEGERPLVELAKALRRGTSLETVPNLVYRKDGEVFCTGIGENFGLEELGIPDLSDFPLERYSYRGRPMCFLLASRGCPHRCAFCSIHGVFGGYRWRHPDSVLEEIRLRVQQGYRVIDFEDDNLTAYRDAMEYICRKIGQEAWCGEIEFLAMNGFTYWSLDEELLQWMRRAGFRKMDLSLVSCHADLMKRLRRPHHPDLLERVVRAAQRLGFVQTVYVILGLPGDTVSAMLDSMAFLVRMPVQIGASIFYRVPGMPLARNELFREEDFVCARSTAFRTDAECSAQDLFTLLVSARIFNFLKRLPINHGTVSLTEALDVAAALGGRWAIGAEILRKWKSTGKLYACTGCGWKERTAFRMEVFQELLAKCRSVVTLTGKEIRI
jgi:radical SAM superfamily enzyme YgiQ (UPF0313 family)